MMPVDVAVEEPCTRVISSPSNGRASSRRHGNGVSSHGVDLALIDGRVELGIVGSVVHGLVDDLELVAVEMERMETGVAGRKGRLVRED
jgi:hypothetical protein